RLAFSLSDQSRATPLGGSGAGPRNSFRRQTGPGEIRDALSARCRRDPDAPLSGGAGAQSTRRSRHGRQDRSGRQYRSGREAHKKPTDLRVEQMTTMTTQQAVETGAQASELTPQARRAIWGAFIGFFVDNYDIFLPVIALLPAMAYFIPKGISPTTASIAGAMIFATTLIGRPLGAFIFGHFADTIGRKRVAVISVFGFGVVTLLIALLPGYATWGDTVIYVFIALRLVDGIFLGGEYTSANTLAMEYCPKEKRGLYGAIIKSAASLGTAAIALVALVVLRFLPAGSLDAPYVQWGWRIPFVFGAIMAFGLAIYYQRSVEESEMWRKSKRTQSPIKTLFQGENLKSFLQVFTVMTGF